MTVQEPAWQAAEAAIQALAPEASEFGSLDLAGFGESLLAVLAPAAGHPGDTAAAMLRFGASLARIGPATALRWLGWDTDPPVPVQDDKRFADRAWHDNPTFFAIRQAYLASRVPPWTLNSCLFAICGKPGSGSQFARGVSTGPVCASPSRFARSGATLSCPE